MLTDKPNKKAGDAMTKKKMFVTGKLYGFYFDGKLVGVDISISSAMAYVTWCAREWDKMSIDYFDENTPIEKDSMRKLIENKKKSIELCRAFSQVDESLLERENLPMQVTKEMYEHRKDYEYHK